MIAQQEQVVATDGASVERMAAELAIAVDIGAAHQARGSVVAQIERLNAELRTRPARRSERDGLADQAGQDRERIQQQWQAHLPLPEGIEAPATELPSVADLAAIDNALTRVLTELDEPQVQQRLNDLANAHGGIAAEEQAAQTEIAQRQAEITRRLGELGLTVGPQRDAITAVFPVMQEVTPADEERLVAALDGAKAELGAVRRRASELAGQLGLQGLTLDVDTTAAELDALQHELQVKTQAERIVKGVRERMVQKVLPNTERNMCLLLPLLTADRYRDCQITPDYKLQVWDESAGRYVAKNIFSGGTRDQL